MFPRVDEIFSLRRFLPNLSSSISQEVALNVSDNWMSQFRSQLRQRATKCGCQSRWDYRLNPSGVGSSVNVAVFAFTDAYKLGHQFVFTDPYIRDLIVDERFCPKSSQPFESQLPLRANTENETSISKILRPRRARAQASRPYPSQKCNTSGVPLIKDQGLFWWETHVMAWMLRPKSSLATHFKGVMESMEWDQWRPILGVHVRHGDSCMRTEQRRAARKCEGLSRYLKEVKQMTKYGYKAIYIATDDKDVVREAKALFGGLKVLLGPTTQAQVRPTNRMFEVFRDRMQLPELRQEYMEVITDIFLLASCDGLVGKFSSNIARVAYSLNFGQRGCAMPFIALDSYYCSAANNHLGRAFNGKIFTCVR